MKFYCCYYYYYLNIFFFFKQSERLYLKEYLKVTENVCLLFYDMECVVLFLSDSFA